MKLLTILLLFSSGVTACAAEVARAHVFFVPWAVQTSDAMWPDEARRMATVSLVMSVPADIARLLSFVPVDRLKKNPKLSVQDIRLVIDLEYSSGEKVAYIASRLLISDERTPDVNCGIDETFRSSFEAWITKKANQSLEPTPTAGTSAAEQPLVPAAVVAHL